MYNICTMSISNLWALLVNFRVRNFGDSIVISCLFIGLFFLRNTIKDKPFFLEIREKKKLTGFSLFLQMQEPNDF